MLTTMLGGVCNRTEEEIRQKTNDTINKGTQATKQREQQVLLLRAKLTQAAVAIGCVK